MMETYLEGEDDALDGFEFLAVAEAGEVCHWKILRTLHETAANTEIASLTDGAIPIQERHYETVTSTALEIASEEDPAETE